MKKDNKKGQMLSLPQGKKHNQFYLKWERFFKNNLVKEKQICPDKAYLKT